ncbi:hypothetical protein DFJ73DRAFT_965112 [Zopfochytrium polystomum]|nr:hypothetical protein DFJ73DRAFT_965112 [Zopfochytrium polystomum]
MSASTSALVAAPEAAATPPQPPSSTTPSDLSVLRFLEDHVLFRNLERDFVRTLANAMQSRLYNANEYVIRKGEIGKAMFFVQRGEVHVISEDEETVYNVLREQSFFGEIGVLFSVPRTASCRTNGRCLILALTKDKLGSILAEYPKVAESINMIAEERYAMHKKQREAAFKVDFAQELDMAVTNNELRNIPLFRDCEVGFLHRLALSLKPLQFQRHEVILSKGAVAGEMYFVVSGFAEVVRELDGKAVAEFQPGTFFGEVGLFYQIARTATVRAGSLLTVFKLAKSDLELVLREYPDIDAKIREEARHRLEYNQIRQRAGLSNVQEAVTEIEVVREMLKNIPLFQHATNNFYDELTLGLRLKLYEPKSPIIQKGAPGDSMFFVMDGTACVVSESGDTVYSEITSDSFFGEVALFYKVKRTATVIARTVCTCFELHKDVLQRILVHHPQLEERVREKARQNYEMALARELAIKAVNVEDAQKFTEEAIIERLKKVTTFKSCSHAFLKSLANHTTIKTYECGSVIISTGDPSTAMFFIATGRVEIVSADGSAVFDTLSEGQFFGEVGLIKNVARSATVRVASPTSVVIELTSQAVQSVLNEYPGAYEIIALEAENRYKAVLSRKTLATADAAAGGKIFPTSASTSSLPLVDSDVPVAVDFDATAPVTADTAETSPDGRVKTIERRPASSLTIGGRRRERRRSLTSIFRRSSKGKNEARDEKAAMDGKGAVRTKNVLSKFVKSITNHLRRKDDDQKIAHNKILPVQRPSPSSPKPSSDRKLAVKSVRTHFFHLPTKTIIQIFDFLNPADRVRFECTCRYAFHLIANPHFWRFLDLHSVYRRLNRIVAVGLFFRGGPMLTTVNLDTCWMLLDEDLHTLVSESPNIVRFGMSNCWKITDEGVSVLAATLEHLRSFDMSYCSQISGAGFKEHCWWNLEAVDLSYCKQISDDAFERFVRCTSSIKDLRLRRCLRLSERAVFLIVRYCSEVRHLDLGDCDKAITDRCLKWISSGCTQLTSLRLSFCTRITNGGLFDLSVGAYAFHHLDLSHCSQISDVAVAFFADSFHSLRTISLRRCKKITNATAAFLAKRAPLLEVVDLSGCPLVVPAAAEDTLRRARPAVTAAAAAAAGRCVVLVDAVHGPEEIARRRAMTRPREVAVAEVFSSGTAARGRASRPMTPVGARRTR